MARYPPIARLWGDAERGLRRIGREKKPRVARQTDTFLIKTKNFYFLMPSGDTPSNPHKYDNPGESAGKGDRTLPANRFHPTILRVPTGGRPFRALAEVPTSVGICDESRGIAVPPQIRNTWTD